MKYRLCDRFGGGLRLTRVPTSSTRRSGPGLGKPPHIYGHIPPMGMWIPAVAHEWAARKEGSQPSPTERGLTTPDGHKGSRPHRIRGNGKRARAMKKRADAVNILIAHINRQIEIEANKVKSTPEVVLTIDNPNMF
jgi:hypothetical protein